MSVLSDTTLKALIADEQIGIDPYDPELIQAASIDIRLGYEFKVMDHTSIPYIDVREPVDDLMTLVTKTKDEPFILHPGEFALGTTLETVRVPNWLVCRLEGKSSLGRLGLVIHSTAGWIDPGFEGPITLEMSNDSGIAVAIYPEMPVGQFSFLRLDQACANPYRGKYFRQDGPTPSRMSENFPDDA
jgi:dCTP deaminase